MNKDAMQAELTRATRDAWDLAYILLSVRAFDPFQTQPLVHLSEVKEYLAVCDAAAARLAS